MVAAMKHYIITLDTGTTNTRACLWTIAGEYLGMEKAAAGVRDTAIDGSNHRLKQAVRSCVQSLAENVRRSFQEIGGIFVCGMITSNVGL